mgnify:FL=1
MVLTGAERKMLNMKAIESGERMIERALMELLADLRHRRTNHEIN